MDLFEYFDKNTGRGIYKFPHYFAIYERHFGKFVGKDMSILEIGVKEGGSLLMWKKYFGEKAKIYGIDQNDGSHVDDEQIKTFMGLQQDPEFLAKVKEEVGSLDIVIDDGSHVPKHQIASFEALFPILNEGGIYLIEDMNESYAEHQGYGWKHPDSCFEYFKDHVDMIQTFYNADRPDIAKDNSKLFYFVAFYYNMIVIEKHNRSSTHRSPYRTGDWKYKELYG